MENNKIEAVSLFTCGYCQNNLRVMFKGEKNKSLRFPANVLCIKHRDFSYILYDTGYSHLIYENGIVSKVYNRFNPTTVTEKDSIVNRLETEGIDRRDINHIILSHCHPDHIGGLCFFPHSHVILSKDSYHELKNGKGLVFKNMKHSFVQKNRILKEEVSHPLLSQYFSTIYDIFSDGSLFAVDLSGHTKGQLGLYIPEKKLFMAADASWGEDFMALTDKMRLLPRLIQQSFKDYRLTSRTLSDFMLQEKEVMVIFSHSRVEGKSLTNR